MDQSWQYLKTKLDGLKLKKFASDGQQLQVQESLKDKKGSYRPPLLYSSMAKDGFFISISFLRLLHMQQRARRNKVLMCFLHRYALIRHVKVTDISLLVEIKREFHLFYARN